MSEYTDYLALLTDAQTVLDLRGALEEVVPWAVVGLPVNDEFDQAVAEAEWAALPKPAWVTIVMPTGIGDLQSLGPAFHLTVEEDFSAWGLELTCGGDVWQYAMRSEVTAGDSILALNPALSDPQADAAGVARTAGSAPGQASAGRVRPAGC